jgi:hypothetical protein
MVPLNSVRASGPGPGRGPVDDVGIHGASGPGRCPFGTAHEPPSEEQLTIAPLPWVRIWRSSNFMQLQTPRSRSPLSRSTPVQPDGCARQSARRARR